MKLAYKQGGQEYCTQDTSRLEAEDLQLLRGAELAIAASLAIPVKSVWYLLQNGWSQSLQDSFAGPRAKALKGDKDNPAIDADSDEMQDLISAAIFKRVKAIQDGALSPTPGGGRDPIRTVALSMLQAFAASKGKKLPKDKDKRKAMLDTYISSNKAAIETEMRARRQDDGEITLDDLQAE